jgi:hypothetical protein
MGFDPIKAYLGRPGFPKRSSDFLRRLLGNPDFGRLRYSEPDKAGRVAMSSHNRMKIGGRVHECEVHRDLFV